VRGIDFQRLLEYMLRHTPLLGAKRHPSFRF
jgi:hypothetical protein